MNIRARIKITRSKPDPYSKETRDSFVAEFRLQDFGHVANLNPPSKEDYWLRLPKDAEPGDVYDILFNQQGNPFLAPTMNQALFHTYRVVIDDDMFVYLKE